MDGTRYCDKCGAELGISGAGGHDACVRCGAKSGDYPLAELVVVQIEEKAAPAPPQPEIACGHCGSGKMALAEQGRHGPLYMCERCRWYFGDFLRSGHVIYYDTLMLKVGMYIRGEAHDRGGFEQEVGPRSQAEGLAALVSRASVELGMERKMAASAIDALTEEGVMEVYSSSKDGKNLVGLRFKAAAGGGIAGVER